MTGSFPAIPISQERPVEQSHSVDIEATVMTDTTKRFLGAYRGSYMPSQSQYWLTENKISDYRSMTFELDTLNKHNTVKLEQRVLTEVATPSSQTLGLGYCAFNPDPRTGKSS